MCRVVGDVVKTPKESTSRNKSSKGRTEVPRFHCIVTIAVEIAVLCFQPAERAVSKCLIYFSEYYFRNLFLGMSFLRLKCVFFTTSATDTVDVRENISPHIYILINIIICTNNKKYGSKVRSRNKETRFDATMSYIFHMPELAIICLYTLDLKFHSTFFQLLAHCFCNSVQFL